MTNEEFLESKLTYCPCRLAVQSWESFCELATEKGDHSDELFELWLDEQESLSESERESVFDQMLDDSYPSWKLGTLEYMPSTILKECDPICYREELLSYWDVMLSDYSSDYIQVGETIYKVK